MSRGRSATAQRRKPLEPKGESSSDAPAPIDEALPLPRSAWLVAALVFGSGFSALSYQIAWQREFRLIFGTSTAASAAVIAVFMGGLGLGAWFLGPRGDRARNPLRFYAVLEAGVALAAAVTPALLSLSRKSYAALGGTLVMGVAAGTVVRLLLAGVVLLAPTFLAGGTLGAAARAVEDARDRRRRATALLYGVNTLGAVAGCLIATFGLLEAVGTRATLWIAVAVNVVLASAAAWVASRQASAGPRELIAVVGGASSPRPPFVPAAAAVTGFAFFLLELVWYRMLGPILGGTVYTFGLVLGIALLGIGAGGVLYALAFKHRPVGLSAFALTCFLQAACIAVPYALGDRIALLALAWRPAPGALLEEYLLGWTLVTAAVVLPAALVAGAQFPLLVALQGGGREEVARQFGRIYFWNTMGGIAGALAGGFGLLPLLSAPGSWRAAALLMAVLGPAMMLAARQPLRSVLAAASGVAVVAAVLFLADGPTAVWRHGSIGVGRASAPNPLTPNATRAWASEMRRSIVWEREGVESSVAVQALAGLSFVLNGKVDGNARNDAPTQVMSGLLGTLLNPRARRSMVIGLGTGSTAGWLATVPGMQRTDVVELEPAILDVARMCAPVNRDVMNDPRVNVITGDAREVLTTGRDRYDLIFSEPSNPYRAGVASLFTREFYEAAASRLEPDGLFMQWVQAYEVDPRTVSTIVATLADVFPAVEVWQVHQVDLALVASRQSLQLDASALRARLRDEPFATALRAAWRATDLEDVLARFVAGPKLTEQLRRNEAERNTDDRNVVEFSFARTLSRNGLFEVRQLREAAAATGADRPAIAGEVDWARVRRQRVAIYTIAGKHAPQDPALAEPERIRAEAHAKFLEGELRAAVTHFRTQETPPEGAVDTTLFAEGLADAGDTAAIPYIQALNTISVPEAQAATARLALRAGNLDVALSGLVAAFTQYQSDPWPSQVSMSHALSLAQELAAAQPSSAPLLADVLSRPFAAGALEEPRRLVRLYIAMGRGVDARCADVLEPFEPHVPWRKEVLEFRANCYRATHSPLAGQARDDLDRYVSSD